MRERLEGILARTEKARGWGAAALPFQSLINRDGYVPVKTRLTVDDLDLLMAAREELLCFSELGLRLLDLHQPRDAGGITSDAAHPILRCRSCMWRWPCPTFRAMSEALETLPATGHEAAADALPAAAPQDAPVPGGGPAVADISGGENGSAQQDGPAAAPASLGTGSLSSSNGAAPAVNGSHSANGTNSTNGAKGTNGANGANRSAPYADSGSGRVNGRGRAGDSADSGDSAEQANGAGGAAAGPRSGRGVGDGQPDLEAAARAFVDDGDRSFVRFDDAARDGQAESRAPIGARGARGLAAKGHVEDPW